jgi:Zn-dependent peptidase ImmA (M78 family)
VTLPANEVWYSLKKKKIEYVAKLLVHAIAASSHCSHSIEKLTSALGIQIRYQSLAVDGYLSVDKDAGKYVVIVNKNLPAIRQRFTICHELAHWLLVEKYGIRSLPRSDSAQMDETIERVCDHFACLTMLAQNPPDITRIVRRGSVDFDSLEAIARSSQIPLRSVLIHAQRSGVLNATEQAIISFRAMVHPWAGKNWDLRIWHSACPSWGFVPVSRRAAKFGFDGLLRSWRSMPFKTEISIHEDFSVMEKSSGETWDPLGYKTISSKRNTGEPLWKQVRMREEVRYKAYSNADEGAFIVGLFRWKRPAFSGSHRNISLSNIERRTTPG